MIGKISTGATNDLERVTQLAYSQVAVYGECWSSAIMKALSACCWYGGGTERAEWLCMVSAGMVLVGKRLSPQGRWLADGLVYKHERTDNVSCIASKWTKHSGKT
eukprot:1162020-Pelagomonas_calceolata.AAC.14